MKSVEHVLEIRQLSYKQGKQDILKSLHLTLTSGQIYGVIGPNGAGKSTFFKTLTGIWQPTEGEILWQGIPLPIQHRRLMSQIITFVPQQLSHSFDFTGWEIVKMGRYAHGSSSNDTLIIEQALKEMNCWHLRNRLFSTLSGGEKQRVYLARSLATQGSIFVLDEPASCLDFRHQWEMWQQLRQLTQQNKLILIALHDLMAAQQFCDQLIVLHQGECIEIGPSKQVMTPALLQQVFALNTEEQQHYFMPTFLNNPT